MVEEVAKEVAMSLPIDFLSTGIVAGTGVAVSEFRSYLRRDTVSVDLGGVSSEFHKALEGAIEAENQRRDTKELAGFTDNWPAIAEELADTPTAPDTDTRRDAEEVNILFTDEQQAVTQVAEAYATVENIPLDRMPQAREAIHDALIRAYRRAVEDFQDRIDGTELERQIQRETNLVLAERLVDLQNRLTMMEADVEHILTQEAYNEGFRQFSRTFFARQSATPDRCWRVGFSLADAEAKIPAEREGLDDSLASKELLDILREGENRMVVGRPGSGKSTLCKQVAVRWYEDDALGDVLYRETGTGSQFTSTDALKQAIDRAQRPVLVVVEDAVREQANSIAETIEEFEDNEDVRFLLDARRQEIDTFETTGSLDVSADRRRGSVLQNLTQYTLPALSEADVSQVCEAFTDATGRELRRDPETLNDELQTDFDLGIGEMLLLAFFLPSTDDQQVADGLEAHVRARFETLNPEGDESVRNLSEFDSDLLAEVGAMVNLLNASGIGIHQELVHALAYKHGHDIETHDTIEEILKSLEGWVLFSNDGDGPTWQTHTLWSTLYLRELALRHEESQASSRRRDRSEERVGACLESLFRLFDDSKHREEIIAEFPSSPILSKIRADPLEQADKYLNALFELGQRWPVLAVLFGTTDTALYDLPDSSSEEDMCHMVSGRGNIHFFRGSYSKAQNEYKHALDQSQQADERAVIATSFNNLGAVAYHKGEYDESYEYYQNSLIIVQELDDHADIVDIHLNLGAVAQKQGNYKTALKNYQESLEFYRESGEYNKIAIVLSNLGQLAIKLGNYDKAREWHQGSLNIKNKLNNSSGIAHSLNNLGVVAYQQGDYDKARGYFEDCLDIKRELGEIKRELDVQCSLINLDIETGAYNRARERCEAARTRLENINLELYNEHERLKQLCENIPNE